MTRFAETDLSALRGTIARFEEAVRPSRRARGAGAGLSARIPLGSGALPLDKALGGGLVRGGLHEIVAAGARDEAAASGFAAALAALAAADRTMVWIVEDRAAAETGTPYRPGLAAHGLRVDTLVLVRTRDAQSTLWAAEEALRAGAAAVMAELWRARLYDLTASRRLLLAARSRGATGLMVHVGLGSADDVSSGADIRFGAAAAPSRTTASAGAAMPIPGAAAFGVRVLKRRGGLGDPGGSGDAGGGSGGLDRERVHGLVWDAEARSFAAAAVPGRPRRPTATAQIGAALVSAALGGAA